MPNRPGVLNASLQASCWLIDRRTRLLPAHCLSDARCTISSGRRPATAVGLNLENYKLGVWPLYADLGTTGTHRPRDALRAPALAHRPCSCPFYLPSGHYAPPRFGIAKNVVQSPRFNSCKCKRYARALINGPQAKVMTLEGDSKCIEMCKKRGRMLVSECKHSGWRRQRCATLHERRQYRAVETSARCVQDNMKTTNVF